MVPHPLGYAKDVFELPEGYQVKNVEYGDMEIKVYIGPSEKSHWESEDGFNRVRRPPQQMR